MSFRPTYRLSGAFLIAALCLFCAPLYADERAVPELHLQKGPASLFERAGSIANESVARALDLVGIRYHRGGTSPETGFDCSGFVDHVFEGLGLILPRTAREISRSGETVKKSELQPGDLVFFNTMRRAFSHVGIYIGDNLFVHAPASGGEVRVEDMREKYWGKRFNGARRINAE